LEGRRCVGASCGGVGKLTQLIDKFEKHYRSFEQCKGGPKPYGMDRFTQQK